MSTMPSSPKSTSWWRTIRWAPRPDLHPQCPSCLHNYVAFVHTIAEPGSTSVFPRLPAQQPLSGGGRHQCGAPPVVSKPPAACCPVPASCPAAIAANKRCGAEPACSRTGAQASGASGRSACTPAGAPAPARAICGGGAAWDGGAGTAARRAAAPLGAAPGWQQHGAAHAGRAGAAGAPGG
jgi:hypothetical protein